jgi:hypothetical protein
MANIYLDITDGSGNVVGRFYDGHFMTKSFDSGAGYVDKTINVVGASVLSSNVLNKAAEKLGCTFTSNTASNVPTNASCVIVEGVSSLSSVRTRCSSAKIYVALTQASDASSAVGYPTIDMYATGYSNPTDEQKAEKLIKELYYK